MTTIFVTHDQEEAMEIAEQIVVVNEGRIEQSGRAARALRPPGQRVRDVVRRPGHAASATGSCARTTSRCSTRARRGERSRRWSRGSCGWASRCAWSSCRPRATRSSAQLSRAEADQLELAEGQIVHVRVEPRQPAPASVGSRATCASPPRPTTPSARRWSWPPPSPTSTPVKGERIATAPVDPAALPGEHPHRSCATPGWSRAGAARRAATGSPGPPAEITLADVIRAIDGPLAGVSGSRPETLGLHRPWPSR